MNNSRANVRLSFFSYINTIKSIEWSIQINEFTYKFQHKFPNVPNATDFIKHVERWFMHTFYLWDLAIEMFGGISEFRCRFNQFKRIILSSNHSPSGFGCFLIFFSFVRQKKKTNKICNLPKCTIFDLSIHLECRCYYRI